MCTRPYILRTLTSIQSCQKQQLADNLNFKVQIYKLGINLNQIEI